MAHQDGPRPLARDLGRIGVWSSALRSEEPARRPAITDAAAELDELGYGTIWLGRSPGVAQALPVLTATSRITVATGILSIWDHAATDVAEQFTLANAQHGGRFVLGLCVSHSALTNRYRRPHSTMRDYLTGLDEAPSPVPAGRRVLAALGPKMLGLARDRAAGAHPYLVMPEYTARAREILGDGAVLAPELKVILGTDLTRARATARAYLTPYLSLPSYIKNLRRLGFSDLDLTDGGSDLLLDAVLALGDAEAIRARVDESWQRAPTTSPSRW